MSKPDWEAIETAFPAPDLQTLFNGVISPSESVVTITGQVRYLQDYIRTQCPR